MKNRIKTKTRKNTRTKKQGRNKKSKCFRKIQKQKTQQNGGGFTNEHHLYLNNFSNTVIQSTSISGLDANQFDGQSRPDLNFITHTILPFTQFQQREEVQNPVLPWLSKSKANFVLNIQMPEETLVVPLDLTLPYLWEVAYTGTAFEVYVYSSDKRNTFVNVVSRRATTMNNWMSLVDGNKHINELVIPGTHDSATWYWGTNRFGLSQVRCQEWNFEEQFANGIRFMDIRIKYNPTSVNDPWELTHDKFGIGIGFAQFIETVKTFLTEHPTETLVLRLRHDDASDKSHDADIFKKYKEQIGVEFWYESFDNPTIDNLRGKIYYFTNTPEIESTGSESGIHTVDWADQTPDGGTKGVRVQDAYQAGGNDKSNAILTFMKNAKSDTDHLKLNFMSSNTTSCYYNPRSCRNAFMPMVYSAINNRTERDNTLMYKPNGILPMDFPDIGFVKFLCAFNMAN